MWSKPLDHMDDSRVVVDDVDDPTVGDGAGIGGLPARGGVERRAVEDDAGAAADVADADHPGVELFQGRIGVIETLSHD
jgi:hypothetical protein